jgi:flagellar biosynthesis protein FlhB
MKHGSDGDLFDEHDRITRFLFQVRCINSIDAPLNLLLSLLQPHSVTIIFVFLLLLFYSAFGSMERSSAANALLGIKASAICFLLYVLFFPVCVVADARLYRCYHIKMTAGMP